MVRVVTGKMHTRVSEPLADSERRRAARKIAKAQQRNPLRRVRLSCCGWVRDPIAAVGDWLWCDKHEDKARVVEVAE